MPMDESLEKVISTLNNDEEVSLTLQMTLDSARHIVNIPDGTSVLHLAALIANMAQACNIAGEDIYRRVEKAGISREKFAMVVKSAFMEELPPAGTDEEPDIRRG